MRGDDGSFGLRSKPWTNDRRKAMYSSHTSAIDDEASTTSM